MSKSVLSAVEAIYAAAPDPSLWPEALQTIADVFEDVGAVLVYTRDDGGWGAIASKSVEAVAADMLREFKGQDLRAVRGVERGVFLQHDAVTDRHVVSDEEIESHPYYKWMAQNGFRYFLAVPISPGPTINVAISVQRALGRPPYVDQDLSTMTLLGRHAEKSLRLSIRLLDAEIGRLGLSEALGRVGIGVIALDSIGRIVFSNDFAERLTGTEIRITNNKLQVGAGADRTLIENAIAENLRLGASNVETKPILVRRAHSSRPLAMYLLPLSDARASTTNFLTHTRLIVLLIDPSQQDPADPALVRDLLGLTLGEARIAALIGGGLAPRDAAQKLGISEETARTALKRVFSKVGVSRQSELTALLTRLVLR